MSRDHRMYLRDIRDACEKIVRFTAGVSAEEFEKDDLRLDAVLRNLEVIGEASKQVPPEIRDRFPAIPWRKMAGLRDVVIHHYFGIDIQIIWDIVRHRVPSILAALAQGDL